MTGWIVKGAKPKPAVPLDRPPLATLRRIATDPLVGLAIERGWEVGAIVMKKR